jgi:3-oxoacid CoA-transferase A subunit
VQGGKGVSPPMASSGKIFASCEAAVRDIPDGATIAFGGFSGIGAAVNLMQALADHSAKELTCVINTPRGSPNLPAGAPDIGLLCERGLVRKVICAFTAPTRASQVLSFAKYYEAGLVEAELVPQGTLAERLRAAGAGIPAFYTPTGAGTELAEGKETRRFNGRDFLLEHALPVDYAFIRAQSADGFGNLQFRRSQRNFNPIMAMAARVGIAEIESDVQAVGAIDPDQVHLSGVFVHRLVRIPPPPAAWWPVPAQSAEP